MAKPETLETVTRIFKDGEKKNRCTNLGWVATAIARKTGYTDITAIIDESRRISQPEHLYTGSYQAVQELVDQGDHVTIWTQGHPQNQIYKIASTGIGGVRRGLVGLDRTRFSVFADVDKNGSLATPITELANSGVDSVVIVDDKASNIVEVNKKLAELKQQQYFPPGLDIKVIWARYGAYKDKPPAGWSLDDWLKQVETITQVSDLVKIRQGLVGKTGWMIDFDHTLLDTTAYNQEMYAHVAHMVDGISQILPTKVGLASGLTGHTSEVGIMKHGGMSGSHLTYVKKNDQNEVVVKHHHTDPKRVRSDIAGYNFLADTPLGEHMPKVDLADEKRGFLVLPHIKGQTLRELVVKGGIDDTDAVHLYEQLLDIKKTWWSGQEKKSPENFKSMQRSEWKETLELLPQAITKMAQQFGIAESAFWNLPQRVSGRKLPSLDTMVGEVAHLLENPPQYVVGVHGDATGSNIILDSKTHNWKLIDAEWAGYGDPAESFVRMAKQRSTTTATNIKIYGTGIYDEALGIRMESSFNPVSHELHEYISSRTNEFARLLKDPDFFKRVKTYMAGSYLREMALINKRGKTEDGLLAMVMAGETLSMPALARIAA